MYIVLFFQYVLHFSTLKDKVDSNGKIVNIYLKHKIISRRMGGPTPFISLEISWSQAYKRNRAFADLRYEDEDSISPSTLVFPATKG